MEVVACGLCHTDLCIQNGAFPSPFPNTVGHEGSGKVLKVGTAVTRVQVEDEVLLSFSHCEECGSCKVRSRRWRDSAEARSGADKILPPNSEQTDHPAACEKFGEQNFGRIRNTSIGGKAGIKGSQGEEIVSL